MRKFWWLIRWTIFCTAFVAFVYYAPRWVLAASACMVILAWEIARQESRAEKAEQENRDQALKN